MNAVTRIKSASGRHFARRQMNTLVTLALNEERAWQLIKITGPTWSVATFRCYLLNRKKFGGRVRLMAVLQRLDVSSATTGDDFDNALRLVAVIPPDPRGATKPIVPDDFPRILDGLKFLAQRY